MTTWPIAKSVFTTVDEQVLPVALPASTPHVNPRDVGLYGTFGYGAWQLGEGLPYEKRTDLAPGNKSSGAARLLRFFTLSDIHITDKESPAQVNYIGWSAAYGKESHQMSGAYAPTILSTTQVLDAAVQTLNVLHERTPFDFGIALGDATNNTQYNELRWYIDVLDGKVITPSSGAHAGAETIDYQKPFQAVGLNKSIPWYQTIGNHDQFTMGSYYETEKTQAAHTGTAILNINESTGAAPTPQALAETGFYMGVVDGSTPYGDIIGAGPEELFSSPPTVIADPSRRSLVTLGADGSSSLRWMQEFFNTTSTPVGHGFQESNIQNDFTSYSFEPKAGLPLKIIVLDDTCKGPEQANYAAGCLDEERLDWLKRELDEGQAHNKLMIIAAHIPILPQTDLNNTTIEPISSMDAHQLLADLHAYPNLILWISGHRHMNVVTPQPYNEKQNTKEDPANNHPENGFWEVETASLRDFPQQFRTFELRRNEDNNISVFVTNVDPAVVEGSPAANSRAYAVATSRIFGADDSATPPTRALTSSRAYNAELVKLLTPEMRAVVAGSGSAL